MYIVFYSNIYRSKIFIKQYEIYNVISRFMEASSCRKFSLSMSFFSNFFTDLYISSRRTIITTQIWFMIQTWCCEIRDAGSHSDDRRYKTDSTVSKSRSGAARHATWITGPDTNRKSRRSLRIQRRVINRDHKIMWRSQDSLVIMIRSHIAISAKPDPISRKSQPRGHVESLNCDRENPAESVKRGWLRS